MSGNPDAPARPRFITDRMLGPLCRYLRMMGYDTLDTNRFPSGNPGEDSEIIRISREDGRLILTRDRELVRRAGASALFIQAPEVIDQVLFLVRNGLVWPQLALDRCPLCNSRLRPATHSEVGGALYAPASDPESGYTWCESCSRLYWAGGHCSRMKERLLDITRADRPGPPPLV